MLPIKQVEVGSNTKLYNKVSNHLITGLESRKKCIDQYIFMHIISYNILYHLYSCMLYMYLTQHYHKLGFAYDM